MDPIPPLYADYYRQQAVRVRQLAHNAVTPAVRDHLSGVALEYDQLAERAHLPPCAALEAPPAAPYWWQVMSRGRNSESGRP